MPRRTKVKLSMTVEQAERRVGDRMEKILTGFGFGVASTATNKVNRPQPYRISKTTGQRVGLSPSKPGTPPKVVSARLKQSITSVVERTRDKIVVRIGSNLVYARRLELGFSGTDAAGRNVNQEARPYLRPSFVQRVKSLGGRLSRF